MGMTWLPGVLEAPIPYCGAPPIPATLVERWNLDPILIAALALAFAVYMRGRRRLSGGSRDDPGGGLALAGWAVAVLALVSPLCPLSVALFSARIGQHMVLTLLAAPLMALGRPGAAMAAGLGLRRPAPRRGHAVAAALAFLAALWVWHAPGPYAATFASPLAYWLMHMTTFGAALWLWCEILNRPPDVAGFAAASLSMIQMGLLGALITLAERPVYAPHRLTTAAWGLTQLQDQQLGGAIMWVPGVAVFLAVMSLVAWRALRPLFGERAGARGALGRAA